jgi:hypothetical protein
MGWLSHDVQQDNGLNFRKFLLPVVVLGIGGSTNKSLF